MREAVLSTIRRLGNKSDYIMLDEQSKLANTLDELGRNEEANSMMREVYSGRLKLLGEEDPQTLQVATNYAISLSALHRLKEARALMRKMMPLARRVLGEDHELTLRMRLVYASAVDGDVATLDVIRDSVTRLEEIERTARRVLGGAHPTTDAIEDALQDARAALRAREETQPAAENLAEEVD